MQVSKKKKNISIHKIFLNINSTYMAKNISTSLMMAEMNTG